MVDHRFPPPRHSTALHVPRADGKLRGAWQVHGWSQWRWLWNHGGGFIHHGRLLVIGADNGENDGWLMMITHHGWIEEAGHDQFSTQGMPALITRVRVHSLPLPFSPHPSTTETHHHDLNLTQFRQWTSLAASMSQTKTKHDTLKSNNKNILVGRLLVPVADNGQNDDD